MCDDGALFREAEAQGHLALDADGETYRVDFGEFHCGILDLTSEAACRWYARRIIQDNVLDLGIAGWMADFGEYLPIDAKLASGVDARLLHNAWPVLWAKLNAEAVAAQGSTGEIAVLHARRLSPAPSATVPCCGPATNRSTSPAMTGW